MTVENKLRRYAEQLDTARLCVRSISQTDQEGSLTLEEAYDVQRHGIFLRAARGEKQVGRKMAFTNYEKLRRLGIAEVASGTLVDAMQVPHGGCLDFTGFLNPRVEPEIAYLLRRPVVGPMNLSEALASIECLMPALEIIDSRWSNFRFYLPDLVADNVSSAAYVLGAPHNAKTDCRDLYLSLTLNGKVEATGSTSSIFGNPVLSLLAAARLVAQSGEILPAGAIVLAGSATAPVALRPDVSVSLEIRGLSAVGFECERSPNGRQSRD